MSKTENSGTGVTNSGMNVTKPASNPAINVTVGTKGPVLIIGAGLIGGSLGLALRRENVAVYLRDASPTAVSLGASLGAGTPWTFELPAPRLVVVATPPDVTAKVILESLREFPDALVFDVSSVKSPIVSEVIRQNPQDATRYCSVHPMAGKEVNGVGAASADLFTGRPWVIVAHETTSPEAIVSARTLGTDVGAFLVSLPPEAHDKAVALVSHVPQLVSSLMGGLLVDAPATSLELAGGGLRDVTRVAASDPRLWNAILAGNSMAVREILLHLQENLGALIEGLAPVEKATWSASAVGAVNTVMTLGNEGVGRIPGKHGDAASQYGQVGVLVPDKPGSLGRLFQEIGNAGVNIEDFRLEHSLGQDRGLAYIYVVPPSVEPLVAHLQAEGWNVATL